MTYERPSSKNAYNRAHQRRRAALLAMRPPCWWCGKPGANIGDHWPPLRIVPWQTHDGRLLPSCGPCNSAQESLRAWYKQEAKGLTDPPPSKGYPGPSRAW